MASFTRKIKRERIKQARKNIAKQLSRVSASLLTPKKCSFDTCDAVFNFKESNHDDWNVRVHENGKLEMFCIEHREDIEQTETFLQTIEEIKKDKEE